MPQLSMHSPVGDLTLSEENGALVAIDWGWSPVQSEMALLKRAKDQLDQYFDGMRHDFDLPLAAAGTAFQTRVWKAIPRNRFRAARRRPGLRP
jgi:methylated-DNA-[protein]-cysteine S-methyltransferase